MTQFASSDTLGLDSEEYRQYLEDVNKNWTGKSVLGNGLVGAATGGIVGGVIGGLIPGGRAVGGGALLGAILGSLNGIEHSHTLARSKALEKHFPDLDDFKS